LSVSCRLVVFRRREERRACQAVACDNLAFNRGAAKSRKARSFRGQESLTGVDEADGPVPQRVDDAFPLGT
jgi:hypothetical protein